MTASCTTGWLDWIHHELWVCDDGLLLRRLDLKETRAHGKGPTVSPGYLRREPAPEGGEWIAAEDIVAGDGHHGRTSDRLTLELRDGKKRKLLWLSVDEAMEPLREALTGWGAAWR